MWLLPPADSWIPLQLGKDSQELKYTFWWALHIYVYIVGIWIIRGDCLSTMCIYIYITVYPNLLLFYIFFLSVEILLSMTIILVSLCVTQELALSLSTYYAWNDSQKISPYGNEHADQEVNVILDDCLFQLLADWDGSWSTLHNISITIHFEVLFYKSKVRFCKFWSLLIFSF